MRTKVKTGITQEMLDNAAPMTAMVLLENLSEEDLVCLRDQRGFKYAKFAADVLEAREEQKKAPAELVRDTLKNLGEAAKGAVTKRLGELSREEVLDLVYIHVGGIQLDDPSELAQEELVRRGKAAS